MLTNMARDQDEIDNHDDKMDVMMGEITCLRHEVESLRVELHHPCQQ